MKAFSTLLLFFSMIAAVYTEGDPIANITIIRSLEEVSVEPYGEDPCKPFSPKMPDFRAPGRRISEVKCFEYAWRSKLGKQEINREFHCFFVKYNIHHLLGGRLAKLGEGAHMGALGWKAVIGTWIFKCGATLISEKFALTAAHCSKVARGDTTVVDEQPKIIRLGAVTIKDEGSSHESPTDANIKRILVYDRYQSPRQYFDIALLELEGEAPFKQLIHPACLHTTFEVPKKATIAGWGVINLATQETSPTLQVGEVNLINSSICDDLLSTRRNRNWKGIVRHQICAGRLSGRVDTCSGDSGGPLYETIGDRAQMPSTFTLHRVIGVTSFGYGCAQANSPGIYTRVASFVGWIEGIVWPQNNNILTTAA